MLLCEPYLTPCATALLSFGLVAHSPSGLHGVLAGWSSSSFQREVVGIRPYEIRQSILAALSHETSKAVILSAISRFLPGLRVCDLTSLDVVESL